MSVAEQKLTRLTAAGGSTSAAPENVSGPSRPRIISPTTAGRMLKVLLHGTCAYDCAYCAVRLERDLLRVPGIGPKGADRILSCRRERPFSSPADLARAGIRGKAAGRHLTFGGRSAVQTHLLL